MKKADKAKTPKTKKTSKAKKGAAPAKAAKEKSASKTPAAAVVSPVVPIAEEPPAQAADNAAPTRKRPGKLVSVLLLAALALAAFFIVRVTIRASDYKSAQLAISKGHYERAQETFDALGDYKDSRVLKTYALARRFYSEGETTNGAVFDQAAICISAIPNNYAGDMAADIRKFKKQFGTYPQLWTDYQQSDAQDGDEQEPTGESASETDKNGGSVQHNGNFYTAFAKFYENAAHFWDENVS